MHIKYCTLTGVDDEVDLDHLIEISNIFPFVEWGILYSPTRQGSGRYPSIVNINKFLKHIPNDINIALHICGQGIDDLLHDEYTITNIVSRMLLRGNTRMQLNFNNTKNPVDMKLLCEYHRQYEDIPAFTDIAIITQVNNANHGVHEMLNGFANHQVLFDSSGGRGNSPKNWPNLIPNVPCGYAGGLGINNITEQLNILSGIVGPSSIWIDMESSLIAHGIRYITDQLVEDHDYFSLNICYDVLYAVNAWVKKNPNDFFTY